MTELAAITITNVPDDKSKELADTVSLCVQQANAITIEDQPSLDNAAVFVRGLKTILWKWTLLDIDMIPREFMMIDTKALDAHVKAKKGETRVPGISIREDKQVGARGL